ncbi:MAG: prevent-host-death protein [Spirosomaceae bacterium]|nr:prevent-host-death protein [Spirosomataceae bacterium]
MKTLTVGDLKANFSDVLKDVQNGEEIAIAFGKRKEIVAFLVPKKSVSAPKRKLGIWSKKAFFELKDDFKMTEEELFSK